jgi:hypothetical protein
VPEIVISSESKPNKHKEMAPNDKAVAAWHKYEELVSDKLQEIYAIQRRMYTVRFDQSLSDEDKERDLMNLARELKRLEEQLKKLRAKHTKAFQEALQLDGVHLPKLITHSKLSSNGQLAYSPPPIIPDDEEEQMKFMRTKSTETLEGQSSKAKWESLFKMFKEWKHQTTVAKAQYVVQKHRGEVLDSEIQKVRAAIHTLRQQKKLSEEDQNLLKVLQQQLKLLLKEKQAQARPIV